LAVVSIASSEPVPPQNLWKGLIAEAISEGDTGMYAVACVVRNRLDRHMSTGLVALKRKDLDKFVAREGKKAEQQAKRIVEAVFGHRGPDITNGATHYENIEKYGMPKWAKNMKMVAKIGEHSFFKERKGGE
jgi:spore germination cell wall hydrolase CwlJ-like protein